MSMIELSTHDAGGITQKDLDLAAYITRIYPRYAGSTDLNQMLFAAMKNASP